MNFKSRFLNCFQRPVCSRVWGSEVWKLALADCGLPSRASPKCAGTRGAALQSSRPTCFGHSDVIGYKGLGAAERKGIPVSQPFPPGMS